MKDPDFKKVISRRRFVSAAAASTMILGAPSIVRAAHSSSVPGGLSAEKSLRIGILWSLTGGLAYIERTMRDVALFWADEVNRAGGIAGLKVDPVIVDAKSDIKAYREGVTHLIHDERVLAVFGGYTSASRRAIMPLVESSKSLLFYPAPYPGRECWQHIVCTGPLANQQSSDLIPFMCSRFGTRVYFIGSSNVMSRESNQNARRWLSLEGGDVVGESYIPVGWGDFSDAFTKIRAAAPDWVFSTVVGESDVYFRQTYGAAGFAPDTLPTASLTTSEVEVSEAGSDVCAGHFISAPYFQSVSSDSNRQFVRRFLTSPFGGSGVTHFNMEAAYRAFLCFHKATDNIVETKGVSGLNSVSLRDACGGISLSSHEAPQGSVRIDPDNFNSWLTPRIGRFNPHGQVDILFESDRRDRLDQ